MTELEQLDYFVEAADELARTRLIQNGFETSLRIHGGGTPPVTVVTSMPDEDDFRSMLMALRPLISEGDETYIGHIYNLIESHVTDPSLVRDGRRSRALLDDAKRGADFRLDAFTPGEIADLYLRARYFHRDPAKRAVLDALDGEQAKLFRYFLHQFALEAIRQVAAVSNIIRRAKADGSVA
jgi:hypothetical protein